MNDKTAVLTLLMRRQRNRKIRNILLAVAVAAVMGWALTYSQQQAFSLKSPVQGQVEGSVAAPDGGEAIPARD